MTQTPLLQKRSLRVKGENSPTSSASVRKAEHRTGVLTKKDRERNSHPLPMPSPRSLKEALKALNQKIHETLASGVRPEREAVDALVSQIQRLSKNEVSSQENIAVIVAEKDHLCEMGLRSTILTLNAIQSLLWDIETRRKA